MSSLISFAPTIDRQAVQCGWVKSPPINSSCDVSPCPYMYIQASGGMHARQGRRRQVCPTSFSLPSLFWQVVTPIVTLRAISNQYLFIHQWIYITSILYYIIYYIPVQNIGNKFCDSELHSNKTCWNVGLVCTNKGIAPKSQGFRQRRGDLAVFCCVDRFVVKAGSGWLCF